jgi:hypothetical protein
MFIARGVSPGLRKKNNRAPEGRHVIEFSRIEGEW